MSLTDTIARGRVKAADRFTETCRIWADPAGRGNDTLDPDTLQITPGARTIVWTGPCGLRQDRRVASDVGRTEPMPVQPDQDADYLALLPVDAPMVTTLHTIEILTSTDDQRLIGREFRTASDGPVGALRVYQRVPVRAVRKPGLP